MLWSSGIDWWIEGLVITQRSLRINLFAESMYYFAEAGGCKGALLVIRHYAQVDPRHFLNLR